MSLRADLGRAIHTLFFATERAGERYRALEASIESDDELVAFQSLGAALINTEPLPPDVLERARLLVEETERREATRPTLPPDRITVTAGTGGPDAHYAARMLEKMYTRWQGTLDYERGVHRLVFFSPFDDEFRRHTSFVRVAIDGESSDVRARNYVLGPYLLVEDYRTRLKSDDPWRVLSGDLSVILPLDAEVSR